jgi:PAS domain S-box-containing protein
MMMMDSKKTKKQLIDELVEMRQRVAELEKTKPNGDDDTLYGSEIDCRSIFDSIPMGTCLSILGGEMLVMNEALRQMLGCSKEKSLKYKKPEMYYQNPADRDLLLEIFVIEGFVRDFEIGLKREDGKQFYASMTIVPFPAAGENAVITTVTDITERKLLQDELQLYRDYLESAVEDRINLLNKEVAEHKHTEAKLGQSEQRFRTLFEQAAVGVALTDATTGQFLEVNQRYCDMFGYMREQMQELSFQEITHPDDLQTDLDNMDRLIKGQIREFSIEKRYRHKNGSVVWTNLTVSPMWDVGKNSDFYIAVVQDITERKQAERASRQFNLELEQSVTERTTKLKTANKQLQDDIIKREQAEEALRANEKRFRDIALSMADWVWEVDTETRYTYCSERVLDVLGYSAQEMIGKTPFELMSPDEATRVAAIFGELSSKQKPIVDLENWHLRKDGSRVCLLTNGVPIFDSDDNLIGYRGVDQDITKSKETEEALRKNEERYRSLFNSIPLGASLSILDGDMLMMNDVLVQMLGSSRDNLLEYTNPQMYYQNPADRDRVMEIYGAEGSVRDFEVGLKRADGTQFYASMIITPFPAAGENAVITTLNDITERKHAERALSESEERYRVLFESIPLGISLSVPNIGILMMNSAMEAIIGYTKNELDLLPEADVVYQNPADRVRLYQHLREDGIVRGFEAAFYRQDGTPYEASITLIPLPSMGQDVIMAVTEDITERKQAERDLREGEGRYRLLFESVILGMGLSVLDGEVLMINSAMRHMLGYSKEELMQVAPESFYQNPEDRTHIFNRFRKEGLLEDYDVALYRKDGSPYHVSMTILPFPSLGKDVVLTMIVDITERTLARETLQQTNTGLQQGIIEHSAALTEMNILLTEEIAERKQIENALLASKQQFEDVVKRAPIPMVITDANANIILYNDKFTELFGYTLDDISTAEEWWLSAYPDENYRKQVQFSWEKAISDASATGTEIEMQEWNLTCKDGSVRRVEFKMTPLDEISLIAMNDITERKQMEESLRESEERYRRLSELGSDYAYSYRVDAEGQYILEWITGESFYQITGYSTEDFNHTISVYHPDELPIFEQDMRDLMKGQPVEREYRIITKSGDERWIFMSRHPVWDEKEGRVVHFYGLGKDITERKRIEEELRQSEERYRIISELVSDYAYSYRVDAEGKYFREWITEGTFQQITGYSTEDFDNTVDIYHPDYLAIFEQDMRDLIKGQRTEREYRTITKLGEERWILISRHPVWDDKEGRVVHFYGVGKDITKRKRIEEELRGSEERYRTLFEMTPVGISLATPKEKEKPLMINDAMQKISGYSIDEFDELDMGDFYQNIEDRKRLLKQLEVDEIVKDFEVVLKRKDGTIYHASMSVVPFPLGDDDVVVTMMLDVTERKQLEQQRLQLVLEKERMQILANFIAQAAHEFKTPLSTININTHLLKKNPDPESQKKNIDQISEQVKEITTLVDALTTMSRLDGDREVFVETVNLHDIIRIVCESRAEPFLKKNLSVVLELNEEPLLLPGNHKYLNLAIDNIIHNAIRYTSEGGTITVSSGYLDGNAAIMIADSGIGISEESLPRVFERFYREDVAGTTRGFGLGLPIAKAAIERHGGTIEVTSTIGEGTTVTILIPV